MDTIINSDSQFIKYTTRKGEYLVNKNKSIKTKLYDHIYSYRNGYLLQKDSLFGLMDLFGNEIVSPPLSPPRGRDIKIVLLYP